MRLDHVSFAAQHDGLRATAERIGAALGVRPVNGGVHPSFGTRNMILPMARGRYVEVVEVLDHPASDKAPFGQAVRARSAAGGGWLGFVCRVDDIGVFERRLGRQAVRGHRVFPDGRDLCWRQIGVNGLLNDPQLPFFVEYDDMDLHPSRAVDIEPGTAIGGITIGGDADRVRSWMGLGPGETSASDVSFTFAAPHGTPGVMAVSFETPSGAVTL